MISASQAGGVLMNLDWWGVSERRGGRQEEGLQRRQQVFWQGQHPSRLCAKAFVPFSKEGPALNSTASMEASGKKDNITPFRSALRQFESELLTNTIPDMSDHY